MECCTPSCVRSGALHLCLQHVGKCSIAHISDRDTRVLPDVVLDAQVLVGLASACNSGADPGALRTSVQRQVVIGLFRDLRGITMATNSRRNYGGLQRLDSSRL